jgi:hypothetical protein
MQSAVDFGVIITCSPSDLWMAKGCCASVRYFMPKVPICLLFDGPRGRIETLARVYDARVICHDNVVNDVLRKESFGYAITKMIAFWESMFENFLQIDADTIVLGDMRPLADFADADLIFDVPERLHTAAEIAHWFFDPEKMSSFDPHFRWPDRTYVCPGVVFAKRGIFSLDDYIKLLSISRDDPSFFKFGDMGIVNYLAFSNHDRGALRLKQSRIQLLAASYSRDQLAALIQLDKQQAAPIGMRDGSSIVLHYAGVRPHTFNTQIYVEPMTYFRTMHRKYQFAAGRKRGLPLKIEDYFLSHPRTKKIFGTLTGSQI